MFHASMSIPRIYYVVLFVVNLGTICTCMDSPRPPKANSGPLNRRWPNNLKHKEFERWLVERDARTKEFVDVSLLPLPIRLICFGSRLLDLICLFIAANAEKRPPPKFPFGKASILISWQCGDMDRYPGLSPPAISDIARDFCKKMISLLVIRYWHRKEGRKVTQAEYKKKPEGWAKDVWYGDPSTCTNNARNYMLKGLCKIQEIAPPSQWLELVEKYERLLEKRCSKADRAELAKELQSWLHQRRAEETVDHLFGRLPKVSSEERNYTIRHMLERLTPYVPNLSEIIQSGKLEEDTVISQDQSTSRHGSDTILSVDGRDPSDTNTASMNLRKGQTFNGSEENKQRKIATHSSYCTAIPMSCSHETGTSDSETTVSAEPPSDNSDCFKDPPGGNVTYFVEYPTAESHDDGSDNQDNKRKCAQEADLAITPSRSKRQKSSTEFELLHNSQIKAALNDSLDSVLDDLMINHPEMYNIFLENNGVSEFASDNVQKTFLEEA